MANTHNSAPGSFKPEPVEPRPRRFPYRKTRSGCPVHFEPDHFDQFGDLTFIPACKCKSGSGILKKMCEPRCRTTRRPRLSATFNVSPISGIRIIPRNRCRSVGVKESLRTLRSASMPNCAGILKKSGNALKTTGPRLRRSVAFKQSLRTIYEITSGAVENVHRIPSEPRRTSKRKGLGLVVKAVDEYDMRVCDDRLSADRGVDLDSTGFGEPLPLPDYLYEMLSPPLLDVDW
ncbi:hypothetical protein B0T11DRAFT_302748 [Plectosphaerella cucumerina]|uniref:Uncharacterized protein n=1 Tax=Plectosphaerella cucumerina TaxID=40658 RepID=A0A8K0T8Q6_9PEZI|nr:hypothetical protein B0T11DRAFT_302748 [Plectosphaerella cucumerina]